ncbi:unnamed protein product [Phytophthora fragariaefolia]|uniref:Unnamed protein product n=1 Tax=Phytophthora fragariaefolia TaxID=1490495 RepID=A0A9W6TZL7_9STRA|nr:unnamed protein product [Phytophthora fragariaefolia]
MPSQTLKTRKPGSGAGHEPKQAASMLCTGVHVVSAFHSSISEQRSKCIAAAPRRLQIPHDVHVSIVRGPENRELRESFLSGFSAELHDAQVSVLRGSVDGGDRGALGAMSVQELHDLQMSLSRG